MPGIDLPRFVLVGRIRPGKNVQHDVHQFLAVESDRAIDRVGGITIGLAKTVVSDLQLWAQVLYREVKRTHSVAERVISLVIAHRRGQMGLH